MLYFLHHKHAFSAYPRTLWNASPSCRAFGVIRAFLLRCVTRFRTHIVGALRCDIGVIAPCRGNRLETEQIAERFTGGQLAHPLFARIIMDTRGLSRAQLST